MGCVKCLHRWYQVGSTVPGQHATERLGGLKRLQWAVRSQTTVLVERAMVDRVQHTSLPV